MLRISMSGKSFVIIDDDGAFATKPVGKGYEITPLASPNDIKVGERSVAETTARFYEMIQAGKVKPEAARGLYYDHR